MKLSIRYETSYRYERAVSFSPHIFRLLPKPDAHLAVERLVFRTNDGADVQHRRDLFDNIVASCFYPALGETLSASVEIDLRLGEKNPFHFLLASHALECPFAYEPQEQRILAPFLEGGAAPVELPFWKVSRGPTISVLTALNRAIFENLGYERREEGAARTSSQTLAASAGACRDFAVLLADVLRGIGVAARLASGYLWEGDSKGERRAEGSLHAWTEAYLPGAGWVGLDPTNGVLCNHNHIATAVGLTPEDVAPITGRYFADGPVHAVMSAKLELAATSDDFSR